MSAMLMTCSSFNCHGEKSVGNNNYEQLAQLNSQIETKHITIKFLIKFQLLSDNPLT